MLWHTKQLLQQKLDGEMWKNQILNNVLTSFNKTREECDMQGLMRNAVLHPFAATMTDAVQQNWF